MIVMSLREIAAAVNGKLHASDPERIVSGETTTDSREVTTGSIFVARPGEQQDGFDFIPAAVNAGATLIITQQDLPEEHQCDWILVKDATLALGQLAHRVVETARAQFGLRVVGITGSNGKTTTKTLVNALLSQTLSTVAPRGSYNNYVGAPVTFLRVTDSTEVLIAEMGASQVGAIEYLTNIARPDVGVVLKVGMAHAEGLGGIDGVAVEKAAMVRALHPDGVAVLNRDDPRVRAMAEQTPARALWFGLDAEADVRGSDITLTANGTSFVLHLPDGTSTPITLQILGEHHVHNALAAAAVAWEFGVGAHDIATGLASVEMAERGRMQLFRGRGITVIHDAYNASPDSMVAALKTLAQLRPEHGRTVAVLGHMRELGEFDGDEHDRIGLMAVRLGVSQLFVVGPEARRLHISAINEGSWDGESVHIESIEDAFEQVTSFLREGDVVLVKASNSAGLHVLAERLGAWLA